MYFKKQNNLELWCELRVYVAKFKNLEMKIENESNDFLEGNPVIDMALEAGKGKESVCIKEVTLIWAILHDAPLE